MLEKLAKQETEDVARSAITLAIFGGPLTWGKALDVLVKLYGLPKQQTQITLEEGNLGKRLLQILQQLAAEIGAGQPGEIVAQPTAEGTATVDEGDVDELLSCIHKWKNEKINNRETKLIVSYFAVLLANAPVSHVVTTNA